MILSELRNTLLFRRVTAGAGAGASGVRVSRLDLGGTTWGRAAFGVTSGCVLRGDKLFGYGIWGVNRDEGPPRLLWIDSNE